MPKIKTVGLEGGPCGGKTTIKEHIAQVAQDRGINTYVIDEVAGKVIQAFVADGADLPKIKADRAQEYFKFQRTILQKIINEIVSCQQIASVRDDDSLIVVDRVDIGAYVTPEEYRMILRSLNYNSPPMHQLVDLILYFPTVAKKDQALYRHLVATNPARFEDPVSAVATCEANLKSISTHKNLWILDEEDFGRTMAYAANLALQDLGMEKQHTLLAV